MKKPLLFSFFFVLSSLGAIAADIVVCEKEAIENTGDNILSRVKLMKAVEEVPEQTTLWGCGKHQCGHLFICAGLDWKLDYKEPADYPLSVNLNAEFLKKLPSMITANFPCDAENNFRVGPTPSQMARYINSKLPADYQISAKPLSMAQMDLATLIGVVERNLGKDLPTLVYYVTDARAMTMHFYSIVGISAEKKKFMILDTTGIGAKRLQEIDAEYFLANMNAQSIIARVGLIDSLGAMLGLRNMIKRTPGCSVADYAEMQKWSNFSVIEMVAGKIEEEAPAANQNAPGDCTQQ